MLFDTVFRVCIVCILAGALMVGGLGVLAWRLQRRAVAHPPWEPPSIDKAMLEGTSERVAAALATGDKIGAIKAYREERPEVGLAEAKRAVDTILFRVQARVFLASDGSAQVVGLIVNGRLDDAFQVYQAQSGASPYEARAIVDALRAEVLGA